MHECCYHDNVWSELRSHRSVDESFVYYHLAVISIAIIAIVIIIILPDIGASVNHDNLYGVARGVVLTKK